MAHGSKSFKQQELPTSAPIEPMFEQMNRVVVYNSESIIINEINNGIKL
jgi:hypothetical protein